MKKQILNNDHFIFDACARGDLAKVRGFLSDGGSVYAESDTCSGLAELATYNRQLGVLRLLIQYGLVVARPINILGEPLMYIGVRMDDPELVKFYVESGVSPDFADGYGMSPFTLAANGGMLRVLAFFLDLGIGANSFNARGTAAIHEAASNNMVEAISLLVSRGANVNLRDSRGKTPLIDAARTGSNAAARWLISAGADTSMVDNEGKSALTWAIQQGHGDISSVL